MARCPFSRESASEFPSTPGVYIFLDDRGRPIYVGKARDLRSRVRAYFNVTTELRLVSQLVQEKAREMDFVVTRSEKEALILENSLIKKHGPLLNIRLKDDKTYFSLRLDLKDPWPRLTIVRRRKKEDVLYFGPYPSALACRKTIQYLSRSFPLRTCPDAVLYNRTRPCLSYEIGHCVAPCVGLVKSEEYRVLVDRVVRFLRGQDREVLAELEREMEKAADALEFERAADIRDRLRHMRTTLENPRVARRGGPDRDVVGVFDTDNDVVVCALHIRDGSLESTATFTFRRLGEIDELLASFLGQFYGSDRQPPPEILLPRECADLELLREVLEERRGSAVDLRVPERGEGRRLLELAERNAQLSHRRSEEEVDQVQSILAGLQDQLGLLHVPERIECFDISHLGGEQVVGSRVSFILGNSNKGGYRHYRLKEVTRNDDFAAMEEVLRRRLRRGLREDDLPDLLIIDGGRAQLARVVGVLREFKIDTVDVIGLAKARRSGQRWSTEQMHERVYRPDRSVPIVMPKESPEVHLLARIRDEAHRFAISYNRRLRTKEKISTILEMVPGIGHRKAQSLLQHFGSIKGVKAATVDELAALPGLTRRLAESILRFFEERSRTPPSESA